jgi:hypothetical protein
MKSCAKEAFPFGETKIGRASAKRYAQTLSNACSNFSCHVDPPTGGET